MAITSNDYPVLDGIAPSWADITVRSKPLGGQLIEMKDIAAINSSTSVEVGIQRSTAGGRPMRRTTGQVDYDGSITFYRYGFESFIEKLAEASEITRGNQVIISVVPFLIDVQHTPPGSERLFHFRLKGCRLLGDSDSLAEGTDADQVECPISILEKVRVLPDGREVVFL